MAFYDLNKSERVNVVDRINADIYLGLINGETNPTLSFFGDEDTYIRKTAYIAVGKLFQGNQALRARIIEELGIFFRLADFKIRQTSINAAGEIGKKDFEAVVHFFDLGLFDQHHAVRNAVIGSMKKMGEVNPGPVLKWSQKYLHHPDKEIRREICHGVELRGRTHPEDILPLLKELQFDKTARVRNTLVHVIGQISYKKGCLQIVVENLKDWKNQDLVWKALGEIIDVHDRYLNFSALTSQEAIKYIDVQFGNDWHTAENRMRNL